MPFTCVPSGGASTTMSKTLFLVISAALLCMQASASRSILQTPTPAPATNCTNPPPQQVNTTVYGYFFGSNAAGYDLLSLDVVDIAAALDASPPDFQTAKSIYEFGKNSRNSRCAPKLLRAWATSKGYIQNPDNFWALYNSTFYSIAGETFMDTWAYEAINGTGSLASASPTTRAAFLKALLRSTIMTVYTFNEVDAAWNKTELGNVVPPPGGAAHNLDEGFAIWVGRGQHSWGTPDGLAFEAGKAAGTGDDSSSRAGDNAIAAFKGMQNAIYTNATEVALSYAVHRNKLIKQVVIIHAQMVFKFAEEIAAGSNIDAAQASAAAYLRTIEPLLNKAAPVSAAKIKNAINFGGAPAADIVQKLQEAFVDVYKAYGITSQDMGKFLPDSAPTGPAIISLQGFKATQSSTAGSRVASYAIDGTAGSYAATKPSTKPWWAVQLPQKHFITSITIKAPSNGPALRDLQVKVGNTVPGKMPQKVNVQCMAKLGEAVAPGQTATFDCAKPLKGSWVTVQVKVKTNSSQLALEDVKLVGYAA